MNRWWNTRRFDLLELFFLVSFTIVATSSYYFWRAGLAPEAFWLRKTYGSSHYSRDVEELIIRDFFADRRDGFFVDVGAGDYRLNSNTFYLEERLRWQGIAIDPRHELEANYRKYRPRTRFFALFVSEVSGDRARVSVSDRVPERSSTSRESAAVQGGNIIDITVPTVTLTDLLDQQGVPQIDLLSIDVELSEPNVLAGFDIQRFKPRLVCIEAHPEVRQQILDYFARRGYVLLGRYLRADTLNLYFAPLG